MEHAAAACALGAVLALMPTAALSQELTDPTRPPAGLAVVAPEGGGEGAVTPVNQLQSVIISPTRKAAIINGVVVKLGGKVGDAVLTRVAEDEVVLMSGDSRQVLKLHPAVDKVEIATSASRKTKPKATRQREANPAADGGMRAR
jgi:MSHA biogenesis protein MshK